MSSLNIYEAANLYVGDDGPGSSKHLSLQNIVMPTFEEVTQDHMAGGSFAGLTIGMSVLNPLAISFKLLGYDPEMGRHFGIGQREQKIFTMYGVIRDKLTSTAKEMKSIIHARIGRMEPDEQTRGELAGNDYGLIEVMHFEEFYDGQEKKYFDYRTQDWRIDGVSQNAIERRILRIPGA